MRHQKIITHQSKAFTLAMALTLAACGSDGPSAPADITYSGSLNAVVITDQNAETVGTGTYLQGNGSSGLGGFSQKPTAGDGTPSSVEIARIASNVVALVDQMGIGPVSVTGVMQTETQTQQSSCNDGSATLAVTMDDQDPFNNPITIVTDFENYCEVDAATGLQDLYWGRITLVIDTNITLSFNQFHSNTGSIHGDIVLSGDASGDFSMTMNLLLKGASGEVYKFENFVLALTIDAMTSDTSVTMNGRFYDPDHGYVDVVTNSAFVIPVGMEYPTSGSMTATGASGGWVQLTANGDGTYDVTGSTDGVTTNVSITGQAWGSQSSDVNF